jgi:hydrogenase maturation protease
MDPISRADHVIFLDASAEGASGEIRRRPLIPVEGGRPFTHHATPEALLAGALELYGRCPSATLITVTGKTFELSESLSPAVKSALEEVLRVVSAFSAPPR